jgi:hypothetical protein
MEREPILTGGIAEIVTAMVHDLDQARALSSNVLAIMREDTADRAHIGMDFGRQMNVLERDGLVETVTTTDEVAEAPAESINQQSIDQIDTEQQQATDIKSNAESSFNAVIEDVDAIRAKIELLHMGYEALPSDPKKGQPLAA